nr:putative transposase (putative), gypsy type [Tanacetum cinerariifolium]
MSTKDTIAVQRCGLSAKELNEFLSFYSIPSEYDVIFPTYTQTTFEAPPGYVGLCTHSFSLSNLRLPLIDFLCEVFQYFKVHIFRLNPFGCAKLTTFIIMRKAYGCKPFVDLFREMAFRNFIYIKDDDDLAFLPKDLSSGFVTGSPSALVNTELSKDVEEPEEWKCKTIGGSSRPLVKRKLAFGSSSSHVVHAKTSTSKDDAPILSISYDDEGLLDCFKLKDVNAYHLKISAITPPAWKGHLDNQIDLELLDLHDRCYARHAVVDNAFNKRARKFLQVIEKMRGEADVIKARERSREEECEKLRVKREAAMAEFDQDPVVLALQEKISLLTADVKEHKEKARLEAIEASLRKEVEELKQDRRDVVSKIIPYAAIELVAAMKEPFDLSKAKGYHSSYKKEHSQASNDFATAMFPWLDEFVADVAAPIEALLSKKPPTLQKPTPSRTQMPRGASPIVISNGTSHMDKERSLENPTRGVFRSTLVALMSVFSYARLFAIWASRLTISMGASVGAVPLSFLLSPRGVSDDFVLSFFIPFTSNLHGSDNTWTYLAIAYFRTSSERRSVVRAPPMGDGQEFPYEEVSRDDANDCANIVLPKAHREGCKASHLIRASKGRPSNRRGGPSYKGYQNTIELPDGNNVVPLRSNTIQLVQNGCSFYGLRSEDPKQHLIDFLKLVDLLDLDVANRKRTHPRTIDQATGGKLGDKNAEESWALLEDLALYDNESWNKPRDFAKLVKAISLPQDVLSTSDRRLIELENQVQCLMEAYLAPKSPAQVNKIASSCEIFSGTNESDATEDELRDIKWDDPDDKTCGEMKEVEKVEKESKESEEEIDEETEAEEDDP